jgi:hypothetical protein
MPLKPVAQGIYINNSNSNSSNSNSNNSSIFSHSSNSNSNSSINEWNEEMPPHKPNTSRKIRFSKTRRVRRIEPFGKFRKTRGQHKTRTRKHLAYNLPNKSNQTKIKASAARLLAAAHEKSNSYNEMVEFIKRASGPTTVKTAALQRFIARYKNFNKKEL